jgi:hypothetical protein
VIANPGSVQVSDASGVSTNEQVTQTGGSTNLVPNIGQGALTSTSQLLDHPISILSNSPLPSNLNIGQPKFVCRWLLRSEQYADMDIDWSDGDKQWPDKLKSRS